MKFALSTLVAILVSLTTVSGAVRIDDQVFGKTLGGWKNRSNQVAEYSLSGANYRTYKPEVSPTPDGGIFVSVRIDHVRGWLSSNDHAILEITVDSQGMIVSAQSNIAIQGRSISSDVILGANAAGQQVVGMDRAVAIGTDLVANLTAKLLREKIVEAGRVSFPAAVRHNYNQLFQSIRVEQTPVATVVPTEPVEDTPVEVSAEAPTEPVESAETPAEQEKPEAPEESAAADPANASLEIKPYATPHSGPVCPKKN
mgnify:CR=1 FL=1